jgi:uncharacterized protein
VVAVTYPGVYVQEVSSGVRPLEAASTSTAAFVGLAEMGPDTGAPRIFNWTEFQRLFGGFMDDGYLAHSVFQFFNNGGRQCYVLRVTRSDAAVAATTVANRANPTVDGLTLQAKSKGAWGNSLYVQIDDGSLDPGNEFRLSVRRQDDPAVIPAAFADIPPLEVFDNLSMDPAAPNYVVDVLSDQSTLINALLPAANVSVQSGFHRGGPGAKLPLGTKLSFGINLDGDGFQAVNLPAATGTATALTDVAAAIQVAVRALTKLKTSTAAAAFSGFTCAVDTTDATRLVLTSGTSAATSSVAVQRGAGLADATGLLQLGAGNGGRSEGGGAPRRPAAAVVQIGDAAPAVPPVSTVVAGSDGTSAVNEITFSAAFPRLDNVTDVSLLAVPGEGTPVMVSQGMEYCARRPLQDMFYLGEVASHDDTVAEALTFRNQLTSANSYGALYFPWVLALDPTGRSSTPIPLPPSGYLAGLYARTDSSRGVWKAPAGVQASLSGVVGLTANLSDSEHGVLNPAGVDVIRRFPSAGVVAFGARTVTSDPEWRYVPVRRTAIMLRVSIYYGIQWSVFEPNDETLWSQLRLNIGSFMTTLFRQGAFQGSSSTDAFFVKCDSETTTQADIDAGVVNVLVGFAALKPAEFVVVRISQKAGQASG